LADNHEIYMSLQLIHHGANMLHFSSFSVTAELFSKNRRHILPSHMSLVFSNLYGDDSTCTLTSTCYKVNS